MISRDSLHPSLADPVLDVMNFLNEIAMRFPEAISFAPGRPHEEFFDVEQIMSYLDTYVRHLERERGLTRSQIKTNLFQYGRTNGHIQGLVAAMLEQDEQIRVAPESLVVTVGCQEGMFIALRALFATPRDVLLVSSPCYIGITGAARLLDIEVMPVEETEHGVNPDDLEKKIRQVRAAGKRPRAFYVIPDFSNPSGSSISVQARRRLLEIAAREDLLLLEDNPYGFFSREGERKPTLKSLDTERRVIYLGSFAKTCFPGARVGYVVADQVITGGGSGRTFLSDELSKIKSMITVNTSPISQALIAGMLIESGGGLRDANQRSIAFYKNNMDVALRTLERCFPERDRRLGIRWNAPTGGFFLVLRVPFRVDNDFLTLSAREFGVLWTPMSYFYLQGGGDQEIRLSCSYLEPARIEEGIHRLAQLIKRHVQ